MAPMAGGIANREEDRSLSLLRERKCFGSPRIPIHRIVRVLKEVGTFFLEQAIGHKKLKLDANKESLRVIVCNVA